jgi:hypothetical protein
LFNFPTKNWYSNEEKRHPPSSSSSSSSSAGLPRPVKLFVDSSLLNNGADFLQTAAVRLDEFNNKANCNLSAKLTYGVQNLNPTVAQYAKGFPFIRGGAVNQILPNVFSVTFCPPHNLESVSQNTIWESLSFDLGFTVQKSESRNKAFVASLDKNSPAAIVGIVPTDIIKFAFTHTLSSPFRCKPVLEKLGSVSLLTYDSSDSASPVAVYHPPDIESAQAAEYAMECTLNGAETTFNEFLALFPFDVTVPLWNESPATFHADEDPILYPVTIVFEKGTYEEDVYNMLEETMDGTSDQALSQIITSYLSGFPCLQLQGSAIP